MVLEAILQLPTLMAMVLDTDTAQDTAMVLVMAMAEVQDQVNMKQKPNQTQSQLFMTDVRMMIHLLILSMTLALNGMMPTQAPVVNMTARPLLPLTYVARVLELESLMLQSKRIQLQLSMTDVRMMIHLLILSMTLALNGMMQTQAPVVTMTARPLLPLTYVALVLELGRLMSL